MLFPCLNRVDCVSVGVSDVSIRHPLLPLPLLVTVAWILMLMLLLLLEQLPVVRVIMAVVSHIRRRAIGVIVGGPLLEVDIFCRRVSHSIWMMLLLLHKFL